MINSVTSAEALSRMIFSHIKKGVVTNCFLSGEEYNIEIENNSLFFEEFEDSNNLYLFCKREGFTVLYYYINDPVKFEIEIDDIARDLDTQIVIEIAKKDDDITIEEKLEKHGFLKTLTRIRLFYKNDLSNVKETSSEMVVQFEPKDEQKAIEFLKENFDKRTGCIPLSLRKSNAIVIKDDLENIIGMLEYKETKKSIQILHLAISKDYRDKGYAKLLLKSLMDISENDIYVWTTKESLAEKIYLMQGFIKTEYNSNVYIKE